MSKREYTKPMLRGQSLHIGVYGDYGDGQGGGGPDGTVGPVKPTGPSWLNME